MNNMLKKIKTYVKFHSKNIMDIIKELNKPKNHQFNY